MKPVEEWSADEYCAAGLGLLCVYGVYRAGAQWWTHQGPAWLQQHQIVAKPGQGLIQLGGIGDLDAPRILIIAVVLFLTWLLGRSVILPALIRSATARARKQQGEV